MSAVGGEPDVAVEVWRRLPESDAPMDWQLAHTEALFAGLEAGAGPTLRWYQTAAPALVLGRSQRVERADQEAARASGTPIYCRTSGGGAVLIDENALSLDLALPAAHPLALRDVTLSYRPFGEVWADALHRLGIAEARALPTEEARAQMPLLPDDPLRLACYGTLSPWEVVVDGRKVVGLSQVRRRPGAIHAMGLHLRWEPSGLAHLLALAPAERARLAVALRRTTAGLDELAGRPIAAADVIAAFEAALSAHLRVRLAPGDWLPAEREAAARLRREQFRPLGGAD
jgi:lipoate-protein ligase A